MSLEQKKTKDTIGRSEKVTFPELGFYDVLARIDTGAGVSALGVASAQENAASGLDVVFFDAHNPFFTGKVQHFESFGRREVRSSNGQSEMRYTIQTTVLIGGRKIRATFTLADRSTQLYPVLIGRNVLRGKFIVDVKQGIILKAEKARIAEAKAKHDNTKE